MHYRFTIKIALIMSMIFILSISTFIMAPVSFCSAQGGYSYPFGGGGGGLPPGYTVLLDVISLAGKILTKTVASSFDGLCILTIEKNTIALNASRYPLFSILMAASKSPPPPPPNAIIIGIIYDFQPSGATFDPSITVTFTYNSENLPEGVSEAELSIAFYDTATGKWTVLDNTVVDPANNTISGKISHFTAFAIIAYTAPEPEPTPTLEPEPEPEVEPELEPSPSPTPTQPVPGPKPRPAPTPTQPVTLPESEPESTSTTMPAAPEPESKTNWWIIGSVITAIIIFSAVTWMAVQYRRS